MTDVVQAALIVSIAPTIAAVAGVIISLKNRSKLDTLHVDLNSRLTQLLAITGASERAQGIEEGRKLGAVDNTARTAERERVEDRLSEKTQAS